MAQVQVQASRFPTRKLLSGGLSGFAAAGLVAAARHWLGWEIPVELASAAILAAAGLVGYYVPPAARDQIVQLDGAMRDYGSRLPTWLAMAGLGALMTGLAACAAPDAATATRAALAPDQLARVETMCRFALPVLNIAAGPTMPATVSETAVYPQAYCAELLAGAVPDTTDANTPNWLAGTLSGLAVAARIAGIVLPPLL